MLEHVVWTLLCVRTHCLPTGSWPKGFLVRATGVPCSPSSAVGRQTFSIIMSGVPCSASWRALRHGVCLEGRSGSCIGCSQVATWARTQDQAPLCHRRTLGRMLRPCAQSCGGSQSAGTSCMACLLCRRHPARSPAPLTMPSHTTAPLIALCLVFLPEHTVTDCALGAPTIHYPHPQLLFCPLEVATGQQR